MDTVYFVKAMDAWEKRTGKKCIMGAISTAEFSQLLQDAQELKRQDREKTKNAAE